MSGFNSIHTAGAMNRVIRKAAVQEIARIRPEPRTARVVEIREGHCLVTYTGENSVVKVPYNSLAPSYVGQVVLIDGPMGDRRIVEVLGRTTFEGRIEEVENFRFSAPLWFQSMTEYPETYPVMLSNSNVDLGTGYVNASPMIAPKDTDVVRMEIRLNELVPASSIRLSLYLMDETFTNLRHIKTATMAADTFTPGITLDQSLRVERDQLMCAVVSQASGNTVVRARSVTHPPLPVSREGQFSMANFNPSYQGNDVTSDLMNPKNITHTMYAVALSYIV